MEILNFIKAIILKILLIFIFLYISNSLKKPQKISQYIYNLKQFNKIKKYNNRQLLKKFFQILEKYLKIYKIILII